MAPTLDALLGSGNASPAIDELVRTHGTWAPEAFTRGPDGRVPDLVDRVAKQTPEQRRAGVAYLLLADLAAGGDDEVFVDGSSTYLELVSRRRPRWRDEEVSWLLQSVHDILVAAWHWPPIWLVRFPVMALAQGSAELRERHESVVRKIIAVIDGHSYGQNAEVIRYLRRLRAFLPENSPVDGAHAHIPPALLVGDSYGPRTRAALIAEVGEPVAAPVLVGTLADVGSSVVPSRTWRAKAARASVDDPAVRRVCEVLLREVLAQPDEGVELPSYGMGYVILHPDNVLLVRAAVWGALAATPPPDRAGLVSLLGDVAVHCGTGVGGSGGIARCGPVATSAVAALRELALADPTLSAAVTTQLGRVQAKVGNKTIRKGVDKALLAIAQAAGLTPGQLLERSVPDFGLSPEGTGEKTVGEHIALLRLDATSSRLRVRWRSPSGRETASVPKQLREVHRDELAELRSLGKQVTKTLAVERRRLEDLMAVGREWSGADAVRYYFEHPLTGSLARALLWQVLDGSTWVSGLPQRAEQDRGWALLTPDDRLTPVDSDATVRLWHPVTVAPDEVRAWRERITDQQLRQPFKQAFREVYLLTPAEETTGTYSNRYAAHVLRYGQAAALMRVRGWSAATLGYWEGGYDGEAVKEIGESGWRASFYYELVEQDNDGYGSPALCSTDQVRFEQRHGSGTRAEWRTTSITDVPPLVFSEAMRDVDLFVGVTSIAADPTWVDGGHDRHRAYWERTSFGTLTQSAEMRREALARLLPRTKLAGRYRLTDRFLVVEGRLRNYKIHLGSGNILMTPDDSYLCIVQARNSKDPAVFLPFEEDGALSVILAKAFLLADDASITDPTIIAQLRRGR